MKNQLVIAFIYAKKLRWIITWKKVTDYKKGSTVLVIKCDCFSKI